MTPELEMVPRDLAILAAGILFAAGLAFGFVLGGDRERARRRELHRRSKLQLQKRLRAEQIPSPASRFESVEWPR